MSSQLEKLVPLFDSANYREWEAQMKAYHQSQGNWCIANGTSMGPADNTAGKQDQWDLKD